MLPTCPKSQGEKPKMYRTSEWKYDQAVPVYSYLESSVFHYLHHLDPDPHFSQSTIQGILFCVCSGLRFTMRLI